MSKKEQVPKLVQGHSRRAMRANLQALVRAGFPREEAWLLTCEIARKARRNRQSKRPPKGYPRGWHPPPGA